MSGEVVAFSLLSILAIIGAVLMLSLSKVMHMMLSLSLTFLSIAGIYFMLSAEFVAVVQILIYSGAITILMLFGIMLTKHDDYSSEHIGKLKHLLIIVGIGILGVILFVATGPLSFTGEDAQLHVENTRNIGKLLFSQYVIPFELTSVLLLVALVGAVILAKDKDGEKDE